MWNRGPGGRVWGTRALSEGSRRTQTWALGRQGTRIRAEGSQGTPAWARHRGIRRRGSGLRGVRERGPTLREVNAGPVLTRLKGVMQERHRQRMNALTESEAPVAPITSASISAILAKVLLMLASRGGRSDLHSLLPQLTHPPQTCHSHQALHCASAVLPSSRERAPREVHREIYCVG